MRVRDGKSGGGRTYGYEVALKYDAAGEVMHGELAINPGQATVIRRIYDDYVARTRWQVRWRPNLWLRSGPKI